MKNNNKYKKNYLTRYLAEITYSDGNIKNAIYQDENSNLSEVSENIVGHILQENLKLESPETIKEIIVYKIFTKAEKFSNLENLSQGKDNVKIMEV